jgi:hypothetical protein
MADWIARLTQGELPILASTRAGLKRAAALGDALSPQDIAREVQHDALATATLLHLANARHASHFDTEITTVDHVVMRMGMPRTMKALATLPVLETLLAKDALALERARQAMARAYHAAFQARDIAALRVDIRPDEPLIAALLYLLPEILVALRAPETEKEVRRRMRRDKLDRAQAETAVFGQSIDTLRLPLLEALGVPELQRDLIDATRQDRPRTLGVRMAVDIANQSSRGWWAPELGETLKRLAGLLHGELGAVTATVHGNAAIAARASERFETKLSGAWLPMLPGTWPPEPDEGDADEAVPMALAAPATATPPALPDASEEGDICLMPDHARYQAVMDEIGKHLDGTLDMNQLMNLVLRGMHDGLGLNRVVFALITPDKQEMRARFVLGAPKDSPLRGFRVPLGGKHLFAKVLEQPAGIWLNEDNQAKLAPMILPETLAMIGPGEFYAMSLFVAKRPVGLVYADRGHGACHLDDHSYRDFKLLCLRAAQGLGHLHRDQGPGARG